MSDFTSGFWSLYVAVLTVLSLAGCAWLLKAMTTRKLQKGEQVGTTGHTWDEDLAEYNNPLPGWWKNLFWITIVFSVVYLALYPGLGTFQGVLGWSSAGQYTRESDDVEKRVAPLYAKFAKEDLHKIAADPQARAMGERLFLNYCAQCHGSDAGGARGFPSLRDTDWLWGGDPETIKQSIVAGRTGVMPPLGAQLGEAAVKDVAYYVLSLSGFPAQPAQIDAGKKTFMTICAACHGPEAKGNPALGAPNLTDRIWLHGGTPTAVIETINKGRTNAMPAQGPIVGEARAHLLAAYVYGLQFVSEGKPIPAASPASPAVQPAAAAPPAAQPEPAKK